MTARRPDPRKADEGDGKGMSYGDYLHLDTLLAAQRPRSSAHDEMLFIIQHQTSELWMKLAIHEMHAACRALAADSLRPAFKTLSRVARIFEQLNSAWDVLRTMTPNEYLTFRDRLGTSSGFQSVQYREIEYLAGNRDRQLSHLRVHSTEDVGRLEAVLAAPSLYDEALLLLGRNGFQLAAATGRDWREPHVEDPAALGAWTQVYSQPQRYWQLYELAEKLVDFEDYFRRWRFNHVTTVERIIGFKTGTGGTAGVTYLRKMLDVVLFPELWTVRTRL